MQNIIAKIAVLSLMLLFTMIPQVDAYSQDVEKIPNGNVFSCNTCHSNGNAFISDYASAGHWTVSLAEMDSDGDGFTNGQELLDPNGEWQAGNADPGNPADVTNPGDSSSHPSPPTPTPPHEDTPTPTPAVSPNTPTPTPPGSFQTSVRIEMPSAYYQSSDIFYCNVVVTNGSDSPFTVYPLFVILDVYSSYFFAPSFGNFDYYSQTFIPGETTIEVLPTFYWPQNAGSADNVFWYAALTNEAITEIVGEMDTFSFGWGE
ncbi:hypothetical protein JW979_01070 [bacterium]|nr:hypothetical protein [candidate division CSSED10-310 bacterium]